MVAVLKSSRVTIEPKTVASSEGTSGGDSALLTKLGGAFFGASNSPQKVVSNVRGLLAKQLIGNISDTG